MEEGGFYKAVEYSGLSASYTTKCRFQSADTIGDYREMQIYTDYNPNTRNAKLLFGLEYDEKVDKFYIAYVYKPKPSGNYPPTPEDEEKNFMSYLEFDYLKWRRTKDQNAIYKMVFRTGKAISKQIRIVFVWISAAMLLKWLVRG